jgi:glycosyltransferase involved in cell wall biosynthesis
MKKKIAIVVTIDSSIKNWIEPFFSIYERNLFDLSVIANFEKQYINELKFKYPRVTFFDVKFKRGFHFFNQLITLFQLISIFTKGKFILIQYSTPNASFVSAIASYFTKIPIRLYAQWGILYFSQKGIKRFIYKITETIICKLSTHIQPDSFGNLKFGIKEKLYNSKKGSVIWNGSAKGIDFSKFNYDKALYYRYSFRKKMAINKDSFTIGFVGRLGKEKGSNELIKSFILLKEKHPYLKMIFVGPLEKKNTIKPFLLNYFLKSKDIIKTGRVNNVEKILPCMDLFVLPSYREGFGMSVIEAMAMGIPVLASDIPGPRDVITPKFTGDLFLPRDYKSLFLIIDKYIKDLITLEKYKNNALNYVKESFDFNIFASKLIKNRLDLISKI